MHPMHFEPAARLPPKQKGPVQSMLQEVRETRVREGPLEVVTLQVVMPHASCACMLIHRASVRATPPEKVKEAANRPP
jgi:hypothetical protein